MHLGLTIERITNAECASCIVAYKVVHTKKHHTIVKQLVLPDAKEIVRLVVGEDAARKLNYISVSNDTVLRCVNDISQKVIEQFADEIKSILCLPCSYTNVLMSRSIFS